MTEATDTLSRVGFVHLHVHSSYSLLEGANMIGSLVSAAAADGQPALALTDTNNLYGALEFSEKAAKAGLQPIAGVQLSVETKQKTDRAPHIVLLAMNQNGYSNLMHLVSEVSIAAGGENAIIASYDQISKWSEDLIALTGGFYGPVDLAIRSGDKFDGMEIVERLAAAFPSRLYIELQRHGDQHAEVEPTLIEIAKDLDLPLVATQEPFFLTADDYEAHDVLLAVAEGRYADEADRRRVTPDHFFTTRQQMLDKFADIPSALTATVEIAQRCSSRVKTHAPALPRFSDDPDLDEAVELKRQAVEGLEMRIKRNGIAAGFTEQKYRERLDFELSVIERMQYPGYFLIVSDFIKWAKDNGIPVGPGRGSGAGSLVAYSLTITDVDPLRFGLLFERFLNPDRVSMPDFDIDFCQDRREEVIQYVRNRYGAERVAQIITFGTLLARGVLRDVGRALSMPYGQINNLSNLIPNNPSKPTPLPDAIKGEPKLQQAAEDDPNVARLFEISQKLEGLHRHSSTHAAGVVIGDRPLEEMVALTVDAKTGMRVTQFNMKWVEPAGLVKFDFLGLKTLTTLSTAVNLVAKRGIKVDLSALPFDDAPTYQMLARGETQGVFQLESVGMRRALMDMKADRIEDLIALVALYRPGPMDNIPTYCKVKLGQEEATYLHPKLEPFLAETHGIIVYQEQVMQVAQALSGYSLGEADLLRRAMGKKIKAEMDAQRERFVSGAIEGGISEEMAVEIFELLAKFADYGFNKSHAAAYALIAYQTAYMKANYPVEFMAASMQLEMGDTAKLADLRRDAKSMGIVVEAPSVNRSDWVFGVTGKAIHYALSAIKGVGQPAVEALVQARGDKPFVSLADFAKRIDPKQINRRAIEAMIKSGAFDELEPNRARSVAVLDDMIALARSEKGNREAGQADLFGGVVQIEELRLPDVAEWGLIDRLQREYESVGVYLSGHPLDEYQKTIRRMEIMTWSDFAKRVKAKGKFQGQIAAFSLERSERITKSGMRMGVCKLTDHSGQFEVVLFGDTLEEYRDLLDRGNALLVRLWANLDGDEVKARVEKVELLDAVAARQEMDMLIRLRSVEDLDGLSRLVSPRSAMKSNGSVTVAFNVPMHDTPIEVGMPGLYPVNQAIAAEIRSVDAVKEVLMG